MINRQDIQKLAELSRIKLSEAEIDSFSKEIGGILGYVAQIQQASSGTSTPVIDQAVNVLRDDSSPREGGEYTETLVSAAPDRKDNFIKVKNIF